MAYMGTLNGASTKNNDKVMSHVLACVVVMAKRLAITEQYAFDVLSDYYNSNRLDVPHYDMVKRISRIANGGDTRLTACIEKYRFYERDDEMAITIFYNQIKEKQNET